MNGAGHRYVSVYLYCGKMRCYANNREEAEEHPQLSTKGITTEQGWLNLLEVARNRGWATSGRVMCPTCFREQALYLEYVESLRQQALALEHQTSS